mmetsp:Transcript_73538/g.209317  ORF Transcript_73538/g.209317 Transcript_73538/m.209317 type:complete len:392 (-) Transcript_73538:368-1543(-)
MGALGTVVRLQLCRLTSFHKDKLSAMLQNNADGVEMFQEGWTNVEWEYPDDGSMELEWRNGRFQGAYLNGSPATNLSGYYLTALSFAGYKCLRMNFKLAALGHADFSCCMCKLAKFRGAVLHGTVLYAYLQETDLRQTVCFDATFKWYHKEENIAKYAMDSAEFGGAGFIENAYFTPHEDNVAGAPTVLPTLGTNGYETAEDGWWAGIRLAMKVNEDLLTLHKDELTFLLAEMERLRGYEITAENWREFVDSWTALDGLYGTMDSLCAKRTIAKLFSPAEKIDGEDPIWKGPRGAIGMGTALYNTRGSPPAGLHLNLKKLVGRQLRRPKYFTVLMELRKELSLIQTVLDWKDILTQTAQNAALSIFIGLTNYASSLLAAQTGVELELGGDD